MVMELIEKMHREIEMLTEIRVGIRTDDGMTLFVDGKLYALRKREGLLTLAPLDYTPAFGLLRKEKTLNIPLSQIVYVGKIVKEPSYIY